MPGQRTLLSECGHPEQSVLMPELVHAAYYRDSYRVEFGRSELTVSDAFHAVFMHRPTWMKLIMLSRNYLASLFGIAVPDKAEIMHPRMRSDYKVGEKIGAWPIFYLSSEELVAGRDNSHLDFRLSIVRVEEEQTVAIVISTACLTHNWFGRVYIRLIRPFHRWGLKYLIRQAMLAGRL
ncbi:DUF2867 domain-containing protein [Undibacterium sp. Tian12W]|uniref:DUF2867 domain-containing protein n=1 Tax=Undibacterium sp. Tian12W TaxID=3413054 RepID=UPI003BF04A81